ncbi:serine hydrolase domain-containing protein [Mycobacterium sp.]|uniref:serine hydrolase domain-containing protein n=1 Tax=Mycobacterium sp. TaxID=1785 RepID=UPI003A868640
MGGSIRTVGVAATAVLTLVAGCSRGRADQSEGGGPLVVRAPVTRTIRAAPALVSAPLPELPDAATSPAFTRISALINAAISAEQLPGAVVMIGRGGQVVFRHAYGARKLAGESGLDGSPAPAEPMTEDTIFDLASLTKVLATTPVVMQLYEQGKIRLDDPVQRYLPGFNPTGDPVRAQVTVRMLLTHTSGEAGDVDMRDTWGLASPDKVEGIRLALSAPLAAAPGTVFRYSDINFLLLGFMAERITGQPLDTLAEQHVFGPLRMADTRFLPLAKACGPHRDRGAAIVWAQTPHRRAPAVCPAGTWSTALLPKIAPTALDEEGRDHPRANPDLDHLLRGTVHDMSTRRMGGVSGHAGVFSTAHDVSLYAQALLDRLAGRPSRFPLERSTLELMTTPQQPGHTAGQVDAANVAARQHMAKKPEAADVLLARHYPAVWGQNLRGLGWDIDTGLSTARGTIFPIGSFGHTGFTGTSVWIDPASDSYVVVLSNSIHTRGSPPMTNLRGEVATAAARALGL